MQDKKQIENTDFQCFEHGHYFPTPIKKTLFNQKRADSLFGQVFGTFSKKYIAAHPNPAVEYTEISYTLPYGVENAILSIFDMSGKLIEQKQLNNPINKLAYNTSRLPVGSYTIEIKTKEYSYSTKLIVH